MSGRAERVHRIPGLPSIQLIHLAIIGTVWITIFSISPTTLSASKIETLSTKPFHVMLSPTISPSSQTIQNFSKVTGLTFHVSAWNVPNCILSMPPQFHQRKSYYIKSFTMGATRRQSFGCLVQTYSSTKDRHKPSC